MTINVYGLDDGLYRIKKVDRRGEEGNTIPVPEDCIHIFRKSGSYFRTNNEYLKENIDDYTHYVVKDDQIVALANEV